MHEIIWPIKAEVDCTYNRLGISVLYTSIRNAMLNVINMRVCRCVCLFFKINVEILYSNNKRLENHFRKSYLKHPNLEVKKLENSYYYRFFVSQNWVDFGKKKELVFFSNLCSIIIYLNLVEWTRKLRQKIVSNLVK